MTPLAHRLAKQMMAPKRERKDIWVEEHNVKLLRDALCDVHCFEVSACWSLFNEMIDAITRQGLQGSEAIFETYSFLPAPKTWIEWKHGSGNRIGILLEEKKLRLDGKQWHTATFFCEEFATHLGLVSSESGDYYDGTPGVNELRYLPKWITDLGGTKSGIAMLSSAHGMLLLINSPKIIGRRQHMPHRVLERRLVKHFAGGKFPLHAWTEIKLEVAKPIEIDDGQPHEAHLTGRRALHFVRKHIRIRLGQLEYVSAHWRGDASIGIKQSRYVVVP